MNAFIRSLRNLGSHEDARETSLIAGSQIIVILLGLANSALLARLLSVDEFGHYHYLLTLFAIAAAFGLPGMGHPILKSTLKNYDKFYWIATKRSLLVANFVALLLFIVGTIGYWEEYIPKENALLMLLVAAAMPVSGIQNYESVFIGKLDFKTSRLLQMLSSALLLVATCLFGWIFESGTYTYIAYIIVRFMIAIYAFILLRRQLVTCTPNPDFESELLAQGWRQTALTFFILVASRLDRIVLGSMNPALLAQYHIGTIIPLAIKNNSKVLMGVLASRWGKLDAEANSKALKRNAIKLIVAGLSAFALTAASLFIIIPVIFGSKYQESILIGIIFSLSLIPSFWNYMRGLEDQIQGNGLSNQAAQVVRHIVQFIAVIGLAPYGILWIALTPVIADLAFAAASFWMPVQSKAGKAQS